MKQQNRKNWVGSATIAGALALGVLAGCTPGPSPADLAAERANAAADRAEAAASKAESAVARCEAAADKAEAAADKAEAVFKKTVLK